MESRLRTVVGLTVLLACLLCGCQAVQMERISTYASLDVRAHDDCPCAKEFVKAQDKQFWTHLSTLKDAFAALRKVCHCRLMSQVAADLRVVEKARKFQKKLKTEQSTRKEAAVKQAKQKLDQAKSAYDKLKAAQDKLKSEAAEKKKKKDADKLKAAQGKLSKACTTCAEEKKKAQKVVKTITKKAKEDAKKAKDKADKKKKEILKKAKKDIKKTAKKALFVEILDAPKKSCPCAERYINITDPAFWDHIASLKTNFALLKKACNKERINGVEKILDKARSQRKGIDRKLKVLSRKGKRLLDISKTVSKKLKDNAANGDNPTLKLFKKKLGGVKEEVVHVHKQLKHHVSQLVSDGAKTIARQHKFNARAKQLDSASPSGKSAADKAADAKDEHAREVQRKDLEKLKEQLKLEKKWEAKQKKANAKKACKKKALKSAAKHAVYGKKKGKGCK